MDTDAEAGNQVAAPASRPAAGRRRGACRIALWATLVLGAVVRLGLIGLAPRHSYLWDHIDLMVWSDWAYRHGPTALYDLPEHRLINVKLPPYFDSGEAIEPYPSLNACNYPPLWTYVSWLQGAIWCMLDREVVTRQARPEIAEFANTAELTVTSRVANTFTARLVNAGLPTLADLLMALGVAALVHRLRPGRHFGWGELAALALVWLGPPILLNSVFWTQMDACPTCPGVWCLYFLVARRRLLAGVSLGIGLMLKATAVLILPVLAFAVLAEAFRAGGSLRPALGQWKVAVGAIATIGLIALPQMICDRDHPDGPLRWYRRSFQSPLTEQFQYTTLKAFNLWWLDFLAHGQEPTALSPAEQSLAGLSRSQLGYVLLAASVLASAALCAWRWSWREPGWVALAFLVALGAFALPTRVHERYIYYALPPLVAAVMLHRRWLPVLVVLYLVASLEMVWFLWLAPPDAAPDSPAQSAAAAGCSGLLAVLTLLSLLYSLAALLPWRWGRGPAPGEGPPADATRSVPLFSRREV